MEAVQSIGDAIKLIDTKKEGLKKAYDDLQANFPYVLSSLSLTWSDLDSHFCSLQNSLTQQLHLLESLEYGRQNQKDACGTSDQATGEQAESSCTRPDSDSSAVAVLSEAAAAQASRNDSPALSKLPSSERVVSMPARLNSDPSPIAETLPVTPSSIHPEQTASGTDPVSQVQVDTGSTLPQPSNPREAGAVEPRSELKALYLNVEHEVKALCMNVDGKGLIRYVIRNGKERAAVRAALSVEIHNSPDPGNLILDAMGGFYKTKAAKEDDTLPKPRWIRTMRNSCMFLLEVMMHECPQLNDQAKRRAKGLALMWKNRTKKDSTNQAQVLGFLLLVAAFGLVSEFSFEDLVEYFYFVASSARALELCQGLGLGDGIPDIIQKLISEGKELLAVRFIFGLGMTEKFPPVPLLKTYLSKLTELTVRACNDGNNSPQSQREAIDKEIEALELVMKLVKDHELEAEYPKEELHRRIQQLDELKAERKRAAKAQELQNPQLSGNKRPRVTPADTSRSIAGFPRHLGSVSAPYPFVGPPSMGASSSYQVPPAEKYGLASPLPPWPYLCPSKLQGLPLYGNMPPPPPYGGYGIPPPYGLPYHPH